jgi:hypothetical protein
MFIGEQLTKVLAELKGYCKIIPEENRLKVEK